MSKLDIDALKTAFTVDGNKIIIPIADFRPEWKQDLVDAGYECHAKGDKMIVTEYRKPTPRTEGDTWTQEDTDRLIKLWNAKDKKVAEIAKEFPNRTKGAVKNKIGRLRKAGKIEGRWKKGQGKTRKRKESPEAAMRAYALKQLKKASAVYKNLEFSFKILSRLNKQIKEIDIELATTKPSDSTDKQFAELTQTFSQFIQAWDVWWSEEKERMLLEALDALKPLKNQ